MSGIKAQALLSARKQLLSKRSAVRLSRALKLERPLADRGVCDDEVGLGFVFDLVKDEFYLIEIMPVDARDLKALRFKSHFHVLKPRDIGAAVDRDAVRIINYRKIIEVVSARKRARFVADTLLQIAVAAEAIDAVIDDLASFLV